MPKCEACPVSSGSCIVEREGHRRYCELVTTRPEYREVVVMRSEGREPAPPMPTRVAPGGNFADRQLLVWGCDYRGPVVVDGCACLRTCHLGKGSGQGGAEGSLVSVNDCLACVSGREL